MWARGAPVAIAGIFPGAFRHVQLERVERRVLCLPWP